MDIELFKECQEAIGEDEYKAIVEERNFRVKNGEFFLSVASAISIISSICALCVIVLIVVAMMRGTVSKRKFIVLLSRTSADVVSSLVIASVGIFASFESAYFSVTALCLFVGTFGFIHTTLCNLFLVLIRQLSHEKPPFYKTFLDIKRLCLIVVWFWLFSILYLAIFSPLMSTLLRPYDGCSFFSCQKPLFLITIFVMGVSLIFTSAYYLFVVRCLFVSMVKERTNNEPEVSRQRLKRFLAFGINMFLFVIISALIFILMILILKDGYKLDRTLINIRDCLIFDYLEAVNRVQSLCSGAVLLWLVRITFDSILLLIIEYRRLWPWVRTFGESRSDGSEAESTFSSVQRSDSLKWKKRLDEVQCSVAEMEPTITAWDSPKSQHSDNYKE